MSLYSVDNIKEKLVISLYAKGMSVSDIEEEMREIYEIELSTSAISIITNKVNQAAQEWQNRPLDPVYLIVWMILPSNPQLSSSASFLRLNVLSSLN